MKLKSGPPVDLKLPYLQSFFNESWYPRPQLYVSGRRSCLLQQKAVAQPGYPIWKEKPGTLIPLNTGCFRKLAVVNNYLALILLRGFLSICLLPAPHTGQRTITKANCRKLGRTPGMQLRITWIL